MSLEWPGGGMVGGDAGADYAGGLEDACRIRIGRCVRGYPGRCVPAPEPCR